MANYMMLGHFTDEGISSIEDGPQRVQRFKEICQAEGAKVINYYMLMGQYDVMCILDAPNPDVIAKIALMVGRRGHVRTETMNAFNENELTNIINKLS